MTDGQWHLIVLVLLLMFLVVMLGEYREKSKRGNESIVKYLVGFALAVVVAVAAIQLPHLADNIAPTTAATPQTQEQKTPNTALADL